MKILSKKKDEKGNLIIDNRSKVRKELRDKYDSYFEDVIGVPNKVCTGVLKTIDSIYNYSMYRASTIDKEKPHANQENVTEPNDIKEKWSYDEAGYAIGAWVRIKHKESIKREFQSDTAENDFYTNEEFVDPKFPLGDFNEIWKNFFSFQYSDIYVDSLSDYHDAFGKLRKSKEEISKFGKNSTRVSQLNDDVKLYREARDKHIFLLNEKYLEKQHYEIITEEDEARLVHYTDKSDKSGVDLMIQIEDFSEDVDISFHIGEQIENQTGKGQINDD